MQRLDKRFIISRGFVFLSIIALFILLGASPNFKKETVMQNNDGSCQLTYPAKDGWGISFFDLIDGGTCWSCPSGFTRTAASVKASNACVGFTSAQQVGRYGCGVKYGGGAFFDAINGGTCWTCPAGYKRTAEPVTHARACAKDFIFGPWSAATRKGSDGCDQGFKDPINGGSCWTCPAGTVRTVYPVNSGNACEQPVRAQIQGKYLGFQKLSAEAQGKLKNLGDQFNATNAGIMNELNTAFQLLNGKLKPVFANDALANAIRNGTQQQLWNSVSADIQPILASIRTLQQTTNSLRNFTVVSISVSGGASIGAGGSVEQGLFINFSNPAAVVVKGFTSYAATVSTAVGVGVGVSIGIWNSEDCGAGFSVAMSVGIKSAEIGGTLGIDPNFVCRDNWEYSADQSVITGFAISIGTGAGIPIPASITASFSSTVVMQGLTRNCITPCGAGGNRPCSLLERFPSCNPGLVENCGRCG